MELIEISQSGFALALQTVAFEAREGVKEKLVVQLNEAAKLHNWPVDVLAVVVELVENA